ncbi:MAG: hypothetical protein NC177_12580 [Ruminococcus flavefaciens]|nr:hypothetical protein [Ruminococcus flavefaciens]
MDKLVSFKYINYKGKLSIRRVRPIEIWFGSTNYHSENQWLLKAFDIDKNDYRNFAMKDIQEWREINNA